MAGQETGYPLHQACMNNELSKVQEIVEHMTNPSVEIVAKDSDNRTALHWAISFQNEEIVTYLLSHMKDADVDTLKDDSLWTPIHIASSVGNSNILKQLIEGRNVDLNLQTVQGTTPIHLAVSKKHLQICKFLLENGASVRIKDKQGQLPLHRAASIGSMGLVEMLCKEGRSPVNVKDKQGWTPLFHALAEGHGDVAVLLVNTFNADYDLEDNNGIKAVDVSLNENVKHFFIKHVHE
ncbi:Nas6p NDAI_0D02540 [Naumovozyma dairenensis CBS 421]|uniref:Uncharacterized protein n=1 Tax=Naumovozyma dairenensis (strain ATCC 10597 / BCRC 20456 / CBS 421 / NBRC 0211 / NRRL Y-12639) TaxID=1071378 RepID=G0W9V7_NAUDC|nr:hypothetical protein NDAI_0D02540 [Naumovozyma dairenensis CBS 421]CCD24568.1 hypothetical protein NDAI_0D02540 [Naumovozyma dairenensis CBS 421]